MKKVKATPSAEPDTMRPEYDFTGGVRGKHAAAMRRGYTRAVHHADGTSGTTEVCPMEGSIVLDPDVQAYFPDAEAVNTALRGLMALRPRRRRPARKTKP
jgi:hypothetical protein